MEHNASGVAGGEEEMDELSQVDNCASAGGEENEIMLDQVEEEGDELKLIKSKHLILPDVAKRSPNL